MLCLHKKVLNLQTKNMFLSFNRLINTFDFKGKYATRTPGMQGGYQAAGICVALVFGIGGGILVGEQIKAILLVQVQIN